MTRAPEIEPLQALLAQEHAAVHLFALLGAQVSESADPDLYSGLRSAYSTHRARRDLLSGWIADRGAEPVAAAPTYADPPPFDSPAAIARAAAKAETRMSAGYATMVASTTGDDRRWAAAALADAAARAVALGADPVPLPGWTP